MTPTDDGDSGPVVDAETNFNPLNEPEGQPPPSGGCVRRPVGSYPRFADHHEYVFHFDDRGYWSAVCRFCLDEQGDPAYDAPIQTRTIDREPVSEDSVRERRPWF